MNISYTIDEDQATPLLHTAIKKELSNIDIENLPIDLCFNYFQSTFDDLLQQSSLLDLKSWLTYIRHARERIDKINLLVNDFNYTDLLQTWLVVGL